MSTPPEWIEESARLRAFLDSIPSTSVLNAEDTVDRLIAVTIDTYLPALARLDCE